MPHVILKFYLGKSERQYKQLADEIYQGCDVQIQPQRRCKKWPHSLKREDRKRVIDKGTTRALNNCGYDNVEKALPN